MHSRLLRSFLRVPLFYKILLANALIVVAMTAGAMIVAHVSASSENLSFALLLGIGLLLSVVINAVILRVALAPLRSLEETASRVQSGDLAARVPPSDLADRDLERLATTLNMMLDSAEAYRTRLRDVAARALNAQEEERRRIAQELHDGIAQTLAALRVQLRVARSSESGRGELLERIGAIMGEATEEVRRIAQGLRPPALDMLGLSPAIESHARSLSESTGIDIETDLAPTEGRLTPEAELALYRIVQEALSNAVRHSGARSARVALDVQGSAVHVQVSDTGRGFAVDAEMARSGLGLFGMQERAAYVGGTVRITSEPGGGTQVRVIVPTVESARYA